MRRAVLGRIAVNRRPTMPPRRRRKAGVGVGGSILPRKRRNAGVSNTSDGEGEKLPPPSVRQTSFQREMSYGKSTETTTMAPKKSKGGGALVSFYPVITPITTAVITHILRLWAGITKTTVTR